MKRKKKEKEEQLINVSYFWRHWWEMRNCIFTIELTYPLPNMLKQVLVLLHLHLPSNTLLCAVNEHKLLGRFSFWILFLEWLGFFFSVWSFEGFSLLFCWGSFKSCSLLVWGWFCWVCFFLIKLNMIYCQNFSDKFRRGRRENRNPS